MAESLVKKIEAVKIGLEVFGVEKRIKDLENRPVPIMNRKSGGSGGLADAPSDGSTYGRKDGAWAVAGGGSSDHAA
jgi:hypothetical protein